MKQVLINLVQNAADSIGRDGSITLRAARTASRFPTAKPKSSFWKWPTRGAGSRRKWRNDCSIRFSRRSRTAPGWGFRLRRASCKNTAARCNTKRRSIAARLSESFCRAPPHERRRKNSFDRGRRGHHGDVANVFSSAKATKSPLSGAGDDGLARARKRGFNLVITDLRLPGLSGLGIGPAIARRATAFADHSDDSFRHHGNRHRSHQIRRLRLFAQAVRHPAVARFGAKSRGQQPPDVRAGQLGEPGAPHDALVGQSAVDAGDLQGNRTRRRQSRSMC